MNKERKKEDMKRGKKRIMAKTINGSGALIEEMRTRITREKSCD